MPADELSRTRRDHLALGLRDGEIELLGRMPDSSNATFLVEVRGDPEPRLAVYKPARGERRLWDFPPGLHLRELASYFLSEALGWGIVPPTVVRDGPLGVGSLQLFIEADFEQHYFTLVEDERHHDQLRKVCLFDLVANSTDRKGGHLLLDPTGHLWAIDNGLTFHSEPKLRTVIWEFGGQPIPPGPLADVQELTEAGVPEGLADLLDPPEVEALLLRARAIVDSGVFPVDLTGRRHPWPVL